ANVNFTDPRDQVDVPADFTVTLTDGAGHSASTRVSTWARGLFYPPLRGLGNTLANVFGEFILPKDFLNTVRIPLSAFPGINLSDVRSIRFNFDQRSSGGLLLADRA